MINKDYMMTYDSSDDRERKRLTVVTSTLSRKEEEEEEEEEEEVEEIVMWNRISKYVLIDQIKLNSPTSAICGM